MGYIRLNEMCGMRTREELEKILTPKERAFCWRYLVLRNGAKAAREAGYSENTCSEIAYEYLRKPHLKEYLELIKDEIEEATGVNKYRQVEELAKIAYSNIAHIHNSWIELSEWEDIKEKNPDALSAVESIDTKTENRTFDEENIEVKYVKIKLYSKIAAIAEINKMLGYNAAIKTELTGKDGKDLMPPTYVFKKFNPDEE